MSVGIATDYGLDGPGSNPGGDEIFCPPRPTLISQLTILLSVARSSITYSMVQSPSWEANWFEVSQEIPHILWNPKVHYRTHKRPPPVPILGQPNPVHIPTSHLLEIHPNIKRPSTLRSPQWSLSLRFPHQDPIRPPLLTNTRHMPSPSHSSRFYHPHNIGWGVQIIQLLVMQSPPFPRYLVPPRLIQYAGFKYNVNILTL